ncbi:hypothetical protein [Nocardia alba]|uniref:Prevent-host-death family protein n=1 Tax=Nocardia alba TaxID=225051 RepID=A0A4R1G907_9NOCA|nr:hypothetical protein [Nocardia alba]TCK00522.1 hypothetical protein DFR71_1523 [Nocardia alba]
MSTTATFTELLRHPKEVVEKAGDGIVRITRRDAEDLILMRAGHLDRQDAGIALASRLMRAAVRRQGDITEAVTDTFAWVDALSPTGRAEFVAEVSELIWSAAELGEYTRLLECVQSWQGTAEAYAAGLSRADDGDLTWIDDDSPVVDRP